MLRRRHFSTLFVACMLAQPAIAKCGYSSIVVNGRILNLQGQSATISITLQTPKGDFTKEGEVSEGAFSLAAPFDTFASYGFFGHKCKNRPKNVRITIRSGEKLLMDQQLKFSDAFEQDPHEKFVYRIKRAIEIDAGVNGGVKP